MPTATHDRHNATSPRRARPSLANGLFSPARQPLTTPTHPAHPPLPPMPTEYSSEPPSLGRVRASESQTTQILRATEPQTTQILRVSESQRHRELRVQNTRTTLSREYRRAHGGLRVIGGKCPKTAEPAHSTLRNVMTTQILSARGSPRPQEQSACDQSTSTTPTHPAHPPLSPMPTENSSEPPSLGPV
jgi:hypothetical protein